jgi:hypothetical protein
VQELSASSESLWFRCLRARGANIEPVLLDQIELTARKGSKSVAGLRAGDLTQRAADFIQPFGAGCLFASSFGFCLDRTPGMAFAKTLDPDRKYNPAERFNISTSCSIDVNIGPRIGRVELA